MRTVALLMHVTANFRCQIHTPLTKEPGHEVLDSSAHDTLIPVVAIILATGPLETVVANFAAINKHFVYAKNVIYLLDTKIMLF
jgi:hypothetical protein